MKFKPFAQILKKIQIHIHVEVLKFPSSSFQIQIKILINHSIKSNESSLKKKNFYERKKSKQCKSRAVY